MEAEFKEFEKKVTIFQNLIMVGIGIFIITPLLGLILIVIGYISRQILFNRNKEFAQTYKAQVKEKNKFVPLKKKIYKYVLFIFPPLGIFMLFYIPYYNSYSSNYSEITEKFFLAMYVLSIVWWYFGLAAIKIANLAEAKGKNWESFFWLSMLVSPLVTWLIISSVNSEVQRAKPTMTNSLSDELINLEKLFNSGSINQEEYIKAKSKILEN